VAAPGRHSSLQGMPSSFSHPEWLPFLGPGGHGVWAADIWSKWQRGEGFRRQVASVTYGSLNSPQSLLTHTDPIPTQKRPLGCAPACLCLDTLSPYSTFITSLLPPASQVRCSLQHWC
jgi:hypothetical protein